jgi:drug/metabolite transporter (DMT)-like permease
MKKALLQMHLAVFFWGFTGVLGRFISIDAYPMVWYRTLWSSIMFFLLVYWRKEFVKLQAKEILRFAYIGTIIAIHWVLFYASIKNSNASIALICLSTAGIFTAILDPLITKSAFDWRELAVGGLALLGMYCIYAFDTKYGYGIVLGLSASLLSSVFTILNKRIVSNYPSNLVAFTEIGFGSIFLALLFPFYLLLFPEAKIIPTPKDYGLLFILSFFCTVLGQGLAFRALKKLSSFTVVLLVNLEPVYGIFLAIWLCDEYRDLNVGFFAGIILIAAGVLVHSLVLLRDHKKQTRPSTIA